MMTELQPKDLARISGFLGYDKKEFAAELGIDPSYLSRILNGKTALSEKLRLSVLRLLEERIKANPEDGITSLIMELGLKYRPDAAASLVITSRVKTDGIKD